MGCKCSIIKNTLQSIFYLRASPKRLKMDNFLLNHGADDHGNALCVAEIYGDKVCYNNQAGWLIYNGKYWEKGKDYILDGYIVTVMKKRRTEGVKFDNEKIIAAAKPNDSKIRAVNNRLKNILYVDLSEFDNEPDKLNCKNGVINLKTGEMTIHTPSQKFTYCIPYKYNQNSNENLFIDWLFETITPKEKIQNDEDLTNYIELLNWLQVAFGYSITGRTNEQCLFYLQGETRAGKGLLLQFLSNLMGKPLAESVDFDTFTAKRSADNQNFDLAMLKASRLLTSSESDRANMLNAKRIKNITGNDPIHCAEKNKQFFTYTPQYKIWLASNFDIMADADDDALWGRLRVINFPNSHLGEENFKLGDWLQSAEVAEGALKWFCDGAIKWYASLNQHGLGVPKLVNEQVVKHRKDNDSMSDFFEEFNVTLIDSYITPVGEFRNIYINWCKENGYHAYGNRRFVQSMKRRGITQKSVRIGSKIKRCWNIEYTI